MRTFALILLSIIALCGCKKPIVTIVDTGQNDRIEIARQLEIIRRHSPRIIALDILFASEVPGKDSLLIHELSKTVDCVQAVRLSHFNEVTGSWDSLEQSLAKFRMGQQGFANLSTMADSVLFGQMPMRLRQGDHYLDAFSFAVAQASFGVKSKYRNPQVNTVSFNLDHIGRQYRLIHSKDLFTGKFTPEDLEGRIVLLGYIGDQRDYFYTDTRKSKRVNGVEVHAALIHEIINQ